MADHREHVIQALEEAIPFIENRGYGGVAHTIYDALELLKPIEPIEDRLDEVDSIYRCGNCKTHFYYKRQKYCAICGRMAKWG